MKHTLKQALALFIAVLLATLGPVGALSEGIDLEQVVSENIEPPVEEAGPFELGDLQLDDGGVSLQEGLTLSYDEAPEDIGGETVLELGDTEAETPVVEETEPTEPFDQAVTIDGAVIAVTAEAGVFPEGAALRVEAVNSEAAAQAVEAAVGVEGVYVHRQYRVEIVDGANNVILPDYEQGVPAVRVEGLDLPAGSRVAVYDDTVPGAYEIDARVNEGAIAFELVDAGVYDIFTIEPPTEAQEEAPAEGETEEPAQQPAEGETEESAQQPTEGETEEPTEQSAEGDAEEPAEGETEEPVEQPAEGETEEPAEQPAEGEAEESAEGEAEEESTDEVIEEPEEVDGEAIQTVSVVFDAMPETAVVTVWPAATEEVPVPEAIPAQEDGSFALLPGEYTYTAEAEGYVSLENVPFTVTGDEQPLLLSFALEAVPEEIPEPVAFERSETVNGVVVTVKAEPGVFPEGAELSVKRVPVYKQRQADAAVEEVRDENQNVAVSYTFDIKVIDPATREELQPAEGQKVEVSFALAEVADENLETSVYHIDDTGAAQKLDVTQEDEVTASVETDGFSLYTVEFTYNALEYVLPGDSSVAMSEILSTLGLTGEVTAVEISDTRLFSASNETGEWIVTAHQPFDTTEWMKVTINGVVYEITVTDTAEISVTVNVTGSGSVSIGNQTATAGNPFTTSVDDGASVTLTFAPDASNIVTGAKLSYKFNETDTTEKDIAISGSTATFQMPNDIWNGTGVTINVTFGDGLAGGADEASAVALTDATVSNLAGGYYKVESDISFDHTLNLIGDTYLVIASGAKMTVSSSEYGINGGSYALNVLGEGTLNVTTTGSYEIAVNVSSYTQLGCSVNLTTTYIGMRCSDSFNISGGSFKTNGSEGIWPNNAVNISGGKLEASNIDANINLSYSNTDDYIKVDNYTSGKTMTIANGQTFTDGTTNYSGTITNLSPLNGKKLFPFVYMHLTVRDATCTKVGIKQECWQRSSDGKYFSDANGTNELNASDVETPMIPHNGIPHEATDTHIAYWQCSVCSKYFSNSGCTTEITEEDTKIYRTITIDDGIRDYVTSNVDKAVAGTTVTLTVSHLIDASTLRVNNGSVALTDAGNGTYTFTVPAADVTVTASTATTYSVNLPANMEIVSATNTADGSGKYISGTVVTFKASFSYTASNVYDGANTLTADDSGNYSVTVGTADITVTATIEHSSNIDLSQAPSDFTVVDSDVLTGSTSHTVTIADGANITLKNSTITGGIVCNGTATITLVGTNSVSNTWYSSAGIQIGGSGTILTIKGNGSLNATGGSASAGIGLGRTWGANATGGSVVIEGGIVNASGGNGIGTGTVGNNMTATIGDIIIKGGMVNARLGKGTINNGSTATIGAIKIYDTIDKVDASKITESVTYMHDDTDVTASASTYFTIIEDGDRRIIEKKDDTDYSITITDNTEHGTIECAATTAKYGDKVTITTTSDFGYRFDHLIVKDADNNDVASTGNSFFMPKSNVTVSAVFEQGTHGTTEFAWGYAGPEGYVTDATIYDGVTTVNLQQEISYSIIKYSGYSYSKFLLDNDTYNVNIPYAGGTGAFVQNGTSFNNNGEAGYYDITMTDAGNGKWSVSILKTVGQMDVVPDQTYTGSAITPEPLVLAGSLSLTKGTDYEYSYTNNTNVGTAKVTVTFKGDYASLGSVEKDFNITYKITIADGIEHGTVTADKVCADEGDTVTLTVAPETGCVLTDLTVTYTDGEGAAQTITPAQDGTDKAKYTFTMPEANVQVSATFGQTRQIFIQWSGKSHSSIGLISGFMGEEGNYSAIEGNTVTFRVTPDSGYGMSSVSVTEDNEENVVTVTDLGEGKFSFVMPDYNINLYAECIAVHVDIPTDHGTVTITPEIPKVGNTVTLTVKPEDGYALDTLAVTKDDTYPVETVEITATETEGEYTFTMPAANVTVNATFNANTYTVNFNKNAEDATGTMEPMQLTYDGEWTALTANTFTRTGYGFSGWNTEADGSGTPYRDEESVQNLTTEASIVLYAQWGKDIASCAATVPDQTMGSYSYIFYKFEAANYDAELATSLGVVVKDGDKVLAFGTDYEFGNVVYASTGEGMPEHVGDDCLLEIKGKGKYAGSLWVPFTITVADTNGTWGDLAWTFHAGTLTITGTGAMNAASDYSAYPWFSMASNVKTITIGEGVTSIASGAFAGNSDVNYYSRVTAVTLPSTVTAIEANAFAFMTGLEGIDLTYVTSIGGGAFNQCTSLTATVPATVATMADAAFEGCKSVTYAVVLGSMVNGSVTANDPSAKEGDIVTLTITPAADYTLDTLIVTTLAGTPVTVTDNQFTMPKANVTVNATFKHLPVVTFDSDGGSAVEAQTIPEGGKATKPVDPTKEGYRFLGWYADGATEAFDFNTAITADITLTAHWQKVCAVTINADAGCIVTVTADYDEENGGTPVYSGDQVDAGTVLTVTARAKAGYSLTTTPEATYTVNDDLTITAASEALTYTLTLTHENGAAPTFTGADSLTAVPYGAKVTVTAGAANKGYEFIGWYQTNGKRLTANADYTVSVYGDATYEARYQAISGVVTFMSNGNVQKTFTGTSIAQSDFPADPTPYYGFTFTGWDKSADDINAALAEGGNVTVTAQFEATRQEITVTIYNGNSETATTRTLTESRSVSVTAEVVDGMTLSYWTMDGEIVTYNTRCDVYVTKNCTLRAVYGMEPTEAVGTATLQTVTYNASTQKLSFVAYLTVPEDCTITAAGLVANNKEKGSNPRVGDATYTKASAKAPGTSIPWVYTWNKTSVSIGDTWYARAYVIYTDSKGVSHEIYGTLVTVNAGTDYDYAEKATANITSYSYNSSTKKATFVAYLNVPDGGVISKAGLVAASSVNYTPSTNGVLSVENADYVKLSTLAVGTSIPWSYTWNKNGVEVGDTWYARAYLVYTINGMERTVYSDLVTYNVA